MKIIEHMQLAQISKNELLNAKAPILYKKVLTEWRAFSHWSPDYIADFKPDMPIIVKDYSNAKILMKKMTLKDYSNYLNFESNRPDLPNWYCHDLPILAYLTKLVDDLKPFPYHLLPTFYQKRWYMYTQLFMGPKNSWTPLHFDCLLTNNLFFQIFGDKIFYFIDPKYTKQCNRYNWRWFVMDPEAAINNQNALIDKIVVEAGDLLYIPAGFLHAVRGINKSISFNIDLHSKTSVLKSFTGIMRGMPIKNAYYNFLIFVGLYLGVPEKLIYRFYRSYLNYVS